jgi:hypothetical protein
VFGKAPPFARNAIASRAPAGKLRSEIVVRPDDLVVEVGRKIMWRDCGNVNEMEFRMLQARKRMSP